MLILRPHDVLICNYHVHACLPQSGVSGLLVFQKGQLRTTHANAHHLGHYHTKLRHAAVASLGAGQRETGLTNCVNTPAGITCIKDPDPPPVQLQATLHLPALMPT